MEKCVVTITRRDTERYHEIYVNGVTSGMEVNFGDGDIGSIKFRFDKSRFNVVVEKE